jgi:hypothetical protein
MVLLVSSNSFAALPFPPTSWDYNQGYVGAGTYYWIEPNSTVTFTGGYYYSNSVVISEFTCQSYWSVDSTPISYGGSEGVVLNLPLTYDHLVKDLGFAPGRHTVGYYASASWSYLDYSGYPSQPPQWVYGSWSKGDSAPFDIVPEPATLLLLGLGSMILIRRK